MRRPRPFVCADRALATRRSRTVASRRLSLPEPATHALREHRVRCRRSRRSVERTQLAAWRSRRSETRSEGPVPTITTSAPMNSISWRSMTMSRVGKKLRVFFCFSLAFFLAGAPALAGSAARACAGLALDREDVVDRLFVLAQRRMISSRGERSRGDAAPRYSALAIGDPGSRRLCTGVDQHRQVHELGHDQQFAHRHLVAVHVEEEAVVEELVVRCRSTRGPARPACRRSLRWPLTL